jgi:phosphatidylglycerophosphate synthase
MTDTRTDAGASALQRRPLAARQKRWAQKLAATLAAGRITPNAISLASIASALIGAVALWQSGATTGATRIILLLVAAGGIQLRLLCNLLDGMVAVEGGKRTKYGDLYNDVPDRVADVIIFLGAGYGIANLPLGPTLGWAAALAAVLTAYARLLGGSIGVTQYFAGPMAKQHRMATLTVACLLAVFEPLWNGRGQVVEIALASIVAGSIVGFARRIMLICREIARR